ncbi:MAG: translesion DNA synthesis-associated protein ImuA [Burkholderiaceae bacterium]|jgi:protein ImuA|nr:translesion DNA synthesis-associated protein ImuA [Burkholderiaceae bacterium]MBU6291694.1 translesion DNA synthesis-associated protein ImuA [Burkholderiales bacterium]
MNALLPAELQAHVWRAGQMGLARATVTQTGYAALDRELPDHGWPHAGLIELLLPQNGIGELRIVQPALHALGEQRIALLQPPHIPHIAAWRGWGLSPQRLLWIRTRRQADALWSAEQVLRNGSCGALLFWQQTLRHESLRRLQLAAQASDTVCWLIRPLSASDTPSPAPLRIALKPLPGGVQLELLKRRGPQCASPIHVFWSGRDARTNRAPYSANEASDALLDRRHPDPITLAGPVPALV